MSVLLKVGLFYFCRLYFKFDVD